MPVYSNSRLKTYEECPQAYKFKYIDKVEVEEVRNVYGFLGSKVHETLELLHRDLMNGKRNSLDELIGHFNRMWDEGWSEEITVPDERFSAKHYRQIGQKCIRRYYEKHSPFHMDSTIDTELRLYPTVRAGEREYTFLGIIDRLALKPEGQYVVHDYKTSKNLPTREGLENDRQLALYQLGIKQKYPDVEDVELVWHYLRFGKDIRIQQTEEDLNQLQEELVEIVRRIERAEEEDNFPTRPDEGIPCDWCDYKSLCPEWSHLHETDRLTQEKFFDEDGVSLVDELNQVQRQLNELDEKRSELRERRRELEEAILNYAKEKGVTAVYGTEKKASIDVREKVKFPRSTHEDRGDLESLIKEWERWEEVSSLNIRSLGKIFREREWPEELLEKLDDFKQIEKSEKVRLEDIESD